jgi:adenylate cyclase
VQELGGEILKFVGDGVLAIFPRSEIADACNAALDAAVQAFEGTAKVKAQRQAAGKPATDLYLGLHVGKVLYGNIGSAERLDFTVVGPAVNEVNRIAGMCKPLEKEMLVSSAFAQAAPEASHRLVAMGRYALRGVRMPQMLYTLDPTAPGNKISGEGM